MQEVAFTFANAIAYVQAAIDAGLDVDEFGQRLSFFFNAHNDFLEEIAKFRAARRLWARIMRDRFGATNPRAQQLRFHTQTAGSTLTAQQPDNNIVRVAVQALAAVLGGTHSHGGRYLAAAEYRPEDDLVEEAHTPGPLAVESALRQVAAEQRSPGLLVGFGGSDRRGSEPPWPDGVEMRLGETGRKGGYGDSFVRLRPESNTTGCCSSGSRARLGSCPGTTAGRPSSGGRAPPGTRNGLPRPSSRRSPPSGVGTGWYGRPRGRSVSARRVRCRLPHCGRARSR